jgi:hypothetical protein
LQVAEARQLKEEEEIFMLYAVQSMQVRGWWELEWNRKIVGLARTYRCAVCDRMYAGISLLIVCIYRK